MASIKSYRFDKYLMTAGLMLLSGMAGWIGAGQWRLYQESLGDRGDIEPEAIKLIRFSELSPPLAELVDEALHRRLTGRKESAFQEAFDQAKTDGVLKIEEYDTHAWYQIMLPIDKEERAVLIGGDAYMWPVFLGIEVDRKSDVIRRYYLEVHEF